MEAVKQIIDVSDNNIRVNIPDSFKGRKVEVIVLPYEEEGAKKTDKRLFFKFCGNIRSRYRNTSQKVDELIYGL